MIKDFLQFIKKTILAAKLSQYGLSAPLSKLQTFRYSKIGAQFFSARKPDLDSFLRQYQSSSLLGMTQELLSAAPLCGFPLYFLPCLDKKEYQNQVEINLVADEDDVLFYQKLFKELCVKDFIKAQGLYENWQKAQTSQQDMRLYASLLEEVQKNNQIYEIDWIRTSKQTLVLNFKQKAILTDKLSKEAQKNLVLHFAELFFVEKILLESWQGVLCTADDKIGFLPILNIQKLDFSDINFAIEYMQKNKPAHSLLQSKIIYAFSLLKAYCPDIDLLSILDSFLRPHILKKGQGEQKLLSTLSKHGMVYISKPEIKFQPAKKLTYLLDSKRHKKDERYKKSSSLYIMLLLLAYLLLRYF